MAVFDHIAYRRFSRRPAITPIVDRQKIDFQPVVQCAHLMVVGDDFSVSVEKENVGRGFIEQMKFGADANVGVDRY